MASEGSDIVIIEDDDSTSTNEANGGGGGDGGSGTLASVLVTSDDVINRFLRSAYANYFRVKDDLSGTSGERQVGCSVGLVKDDQGTTTECGTLFKLQSSGYYNLKRHLQGAHGVTPEKGSSSQGSHSNKQLSLPDFQELKSPYPPTHPRQLKFDRGILSMFSVDGAPFDIVNKPGFQNLIHGVDPRIDIKSRTTYVSHLHHEVEKEIVAVRKRKLKDVPKRFCHMSCDIWSTQRQEGVLCILVNYTDDEWEIQRYVIHFKTIETRHTAQELRRIFLECLAMYGLPSDWGGLVITDNASNMKKCFNLEEIWSDDEVVRSTWVPEEDGQADIKDELGVDLEDPDEATTSTQITSNVAVGLYGSVTQSLPQGPIAGHLGCAAHTLQLAINDAIKKDATTRTFLGYVNKIMVFFKRSTRWRDELKKKVGSATVLFCQTRWNSYLKMLERFKEVEFFGAVRDVLDLARLESNLRQVPPEAPDLRGSFHKGFPDFDHQYLRDIDDQSPEILYETALVLRQQKSHELYELLLSLGKATDKLQADGPTSNLVIISVVEALSDLHKLQPVYFSALRDLMVTSLVNRMKPLLTRQEYIIATIIDPRIKTSVFSLEPIRVELSLSTVAEVEAIFQGVYQNVKDQGGWGLAPNSDLRGQPSNSGELVFGILAQALTRVRALEEPEQYLNEPISPASTCPLQFWKCNMARLPVLAVIARKYLAIPATSAGVERTFSISGWLSNARRASIKVENISNLLMHREENQRKLTLSGKGIKRKQVS